MKESDLLPAVIETPDDDAPRLIYADWLEEHGDEADRERAEFIRLQCRLAASDPDASERPALQARERELLQRHRDHWLAPFPAWVRKLHCRDVRFERGFVTHLGLHAAQFIRQAARVFRRAPITSVRIDNLAGRLAETLACPHMTRIRRLDLYALGRQTDAARLLAQAPTLANVRAFQIVGSLELGAQGLAELLASPHLTQLDQFDLPGHNLGDAGCRILAIAGGHLRLRELRLANNSIGPDGAQALAGAAHLAELSTLDLGWNVVEDAGHAALASSPHLGNLTALTLCNTGLQDGGLRAWAGAPCLARLTSLQLDRNVLGPAIAELLTSSRLQQLRSLNLNSTQGRQPLARALAEARQLERLTSLELEYNRLDDESARLLAGAIHLASLRRLNLNHNPIADAGARALLDSPHLASCPQLVLWSSGLSHEIQGRLNDRERRSSARLVPNPLP